MTTPDINVKTALTNSTKSEKSEVFTVTCRKLEAKHCMRVCRLACLSHYVKLYRNRCGFEIKDFS